jgi:hypothetical protein
MLVYGFGSFFNLLPGGDVSSLLLIYGFVISLLGFALAYAQLKPVPCKTTQEAYDVRDAQATSIQKQVCTLPIGTTHHMSPGNDMCITRFSVSFRGRLLACVFDR